MENCKSGKRINAEYTRTEYVNGRERTLTSANYERLINLIDEVVKSEEMVSEAQLAHLLRRANASVYVGQSTNESCVCSVAYPELVGQKKPLGKTSRGRMFYEFWLEAVALDREEDYSLEFRKSIEKFLQDNREDVRN